MMLLAPPIPSHSVRPSRWFPARNGGSRSITAFHDPSSSPIEHRARRSHHPLVAIGSLGIPRQPFRSRRCAITIPLPVPKSP
jgi:hypothetical protein